MTSTTPVNLMDLVRSAYISGEINCSILARESGRSYSAVNRALRGLTDVPESDARRYFESLVQIRNARQKAATIYTTDHHDDVIG
jgi:hypothetical protein